MWHKVTICRNLGPHMRNPHANMESNSLYGQETMKLESNMNSERPIMWKLSLLEKGLLGFTAHEISLCYPRPSAALWRKYTPSVRNLKFFSRGVWVRTPHLPNCAHTSTKRYKARQTCTCRDYERRKQTSCFMQNMWTCGWGWMLVDGVWGVTW